MFLEKKEFIESYIKQLEDVLYEYYQVGTFASQKILFDVIVDIISVFSNEISYITDSVLLQKNSCERDANAVLGILKLYLINESGKDIQQKPEKNLQPIIFLSHNSKDKKYSDALEKFIVGLGIKNQQLIYTSHALHKIPLDKNIYDYLRESISGNVFVIILWSNDYLSSPACLNEMGAAWIAQKDYTNIYTPDFDFGNPKYHECAVDTRKMGAVLNGNDSFKISMIELKNKISSLFNLSTDESTSIYLIDQLLNNIK